MLFLTYLRAERQGRAIPRYRECTGCGRFTHLTELAVTTDDRHICLDCKTLFYPPLDFSALRLIQLREPEHPFMLRLNEKGTA